MMKLNHSFPTVIRPSYLKFHVKTSRLSNTQNTAGTLTCGVLYIIINLVREGKNMDKVLLLVIDGCSPDYLSSDNAPNIFKLSQQLGFLKKVQGVMPSVTNVNHASILSGKWPNETHVIGNYF